MLRKSFLIMLTLTAGTWLAGCAPTPAPPVPPGVRPGAAPGLDWFMGTTFCLTPLIIGAAVILIVAVLLSIGKGKWLTSHSSLDSSSTPSAREIIRARYARGEIDRQEYWQLLQDIEEPKQSQSPKQSKESV